MSPDGSKSASPEEKLLRLIRGKGRSSTPAPSPAQPAPVRGAGWSWRFPWRFPVWGLAAINLGFGCVVIGELGAGVCMITRPPPIIHASVPTLSAPSRPVSSDAPAAVNADGKVSGVSGAVPSLAAAASRPLFQTAGMAAGQAGETASAAPSAQAGAVTARLTLTGIVAGDPPQAIIEDTQTKKTHFVTVGQGLIEGVSVQEILPDRVVLNLHGEKIELSL